jgi:hypothetical protein
MKTCSLLQKALLILFAVFTALTVSPPAQAIPLVIDDSNVQADYNFPNFTTSGSWSTYSDPYCPCINSNLHRADPGDGSSVAHWAFNNLMPGRYRVDVTWARASTLATNAPFTVSRQGSTGSNVSDTFLIDETKAPSGVPLGYPFWQTLGTFEVYGSTVDVQLTNAANGIVVADAVRIERVEGIPVTQDDGAAGFSTAGSWTTYAGTGYQGDIHRADPGDGSSTATWSFTNLPFGRYQVSVSWPRVSTLATNAPFSVTRQGSSGSPVTDTVPVDETQSPTDLTTNGANWKTLGTFGVYGSTLDVQLSNLANGIVIADAVRIKQVEETTLTSLPTGSSERVTDVFPGVYRLALKWSADTSKPSHVTVTRSNPNAQVFSADIDPNSPADFIANGYPWKIIGNVTLTAPVQYLDATYTYTPSNAPNKASLTRLDRMEYLPAIVDDEDYWTSRQGSYWFGYTQPLGYQGDFRHTDAGSGEAYYRWNFPHFAPGLYQVAVTWPYASTLATNAPFTVLRRKATSSTSLSDTIPVNQATTPNDFTANGVGWKNLGTFAVFTANDTVPGDPSLSVRLSNAANGTVIADAVRVVRVGDLPDSPRIELRLNGQALTKGGSVSFGTTFPSVPISKTFTLRNIGSADLQIGAISLPAGYTLTTNVGQTTLAPGEETTFTVRLDAAGAGTYNGTLSFPTNDPNANPFPLALTGTVSASRILDDGEAGFATTGAWTTYVGAGFQSDIRRANAGDGSSTATWSFNNLIPGHYQVALTWPYVSTSATNAPFSVARQNSGGTISTASFVVNERTTPSDFTASGVGWKVLGAFDVYGSSVTVKVTNAANGVVLADGVRIERIGDLP